MANTILTQQVDANEGADVNPLKEFCSHISESFFEPDIQAARIILGTAFAHYIPKTPPIWMFVVGPPSSGKGPAAGSHWAGLGEVHQCCAHRDLDRSRPHEGVSVGLSTQRARAGHRGGERRLQHGQGW